MGEIVGYMKSGRPIVENEDGSFSTHRNMVASFDGKSYVIPTIYGGKQVSEDEAVAIFRQQKGIDPDTGQPMPSFNSDDEALAYEQEQHQVLEEELDSYHLDELRGMAKRRRRERSGAPAE
jgi:hypothetical protein